ncbi:MFS general substrate transporter [Phanerochaete sordida]|uniref:MFS general substrate transporter n=1 Tax=Phanerochaete sordida TaxID=48140 RepID=A0A9P3G0I0_9APHY|nr:MFS general substrate transporter [Phanerochaete sordida]
MASAHSESTPLLGPPEQERKKKPFYRPRPLWLVPFAIVASIVRGMTLAPRVQVYTQLSCNAVYGHDVYDHTNHTFATLSPARSFNASLDRNAPIATAFGPLLDEHGTQVMSVHFARASPADDDDEPDPRNVPSKRCLSDAKVQAGAARIQTIMTTTMGLLSAFTTGWWGHFGEKYGRTRVLAASTVGLFLTDLTFILVSTPHSPFAAHGHKLLIISPIIEGLLGGWSTLQGATTAYVSDCTSDGSRAQIFSRFSGVFYLGFSVGPMIGAYLIRHPIFSFPGSAPSSSGPVLHNGQPAVTSVFYVAAMCSFINLLLVLFLFPESISKKKTQSGKPVTPAPAPLTVPGPGPEQEPTEGSDLQETNTVTQGWSLQRLLGPLALLAPKKLPRPDGGYRTDWSLTVLGFSLFMFLLATGIFQIKYLYAEHVYEWGAEQLSYYITFMGAVRCIHLLFIMPHLIQWFKPKPKPKDKNATSVSAHATSTSKPATVPPAGKRSKPTVGQIAKEMNFDLILLRSSFFIEFASHALVSFIPSTAGATPFVAFTTMACFGTGVIPAVNSLALCILQAQAEAIAAAGGPPQDTSNIGRLFGALASIQSIGQMILGPLLFGVVYSATVATFPKAIFATAAAVTLIALALLCLLRPDVALRARQRQRANLREEIERGRSRVRKELTLSTSPALGESSSGSSSGASP